MTTTRRTTGDAGDTYFSAVLGSTETPKSALKLLGVTTASEIDAKLAEAEAEAVRLGADFLTDEGRETVRRELRDALEA